MATAKKLIEPITTNPQYKAAAAVLETLRVGLSALEQEAAALRIEMTMPTAPPKAQRTKDLKSRLAAHRAKAPCKVESTPPNVPRAVHLALEIIEGSALEVEHARRTREDVTALLAQLEADKRTVHSGIVVQGEVVDEIRSRLSFETATRLKAEHRSLVLAQYRAAQALSAATTAEQTFHRTVTDAGFTWRADVLVAPSMRSALMVGDEGVYDSEISRVRRMLEELKLL